MAKKWPPKILIVPQRGGYVAEGRTVITSGTQSVDLKSRMELDDALLPKSYEFESRGNVVKLKVDAPLSELEYASQGKKQSDTVRFPKDGVIVDSNFFHHYALLLYRLGAALGPSTVSAFVPQTLELGPIAGSAISETTHMKWIPARLRSKPPRTWMENCSVWRCRQLR